MYTVHEDDVDEVMSSVEKALWLPDFSSFIPYEFTQLVCICVTCKENLHLLGNMHVLQCCYTSESIPASVVCVYI